MAVKFRLFGARRHVKHGIERSMTHSFYPLRTALCLLLLLPAAAPAFAFEAGAAKVDITPPVGTPLNGYGARMGRDSTGVHDPIWARTLYLDDGETRLFLTSVDLVAVNPELRARVLELAPDVVPKENIILTATHTHSGQGAMTRSIPIRFVSGRFIEDVLEDTAAGIAESMRNAYDKRRRAALGYAVGTHKGLSANRRYGDGPIDDQIGVILVEDADGNPISFVTNFAAHPTSVGDADFYAFSADYPGFYYLEMESLLGPDCVPIFINGAQGNQTISDPDNKSGWERTESVGRKLARRAHEIAGSISFSDAALTLTQKYAPLPLTLGTLLQPEEVLLQSLEINGLLMSFFPGEACVELGLNMRRRALVRGYDAHFSVGLSNNYIMYFVPRHLYADMTYESVMNFFGPGIEDWFYEQFEGLMTRPVPDETAVETAAFAEPVIEDIEGGVVVTVSGSPHIIGNGRGNAFVAEIQECYEQRVVQPVEDGTWRPASGFWQAAPAFIDVSSLALPMLGMGSRNLLKGLSLDLLRELEGMAEGARLPFDGLWLLQNAALYTAIPDKSALYGAPLCTMFALTGVRAGDAELVVFRNLDWMFPESGVVSRVRPDVGHAFVQAGFSWNVGVFTAINDAGLTLAVERLQPEVESLPAQAPIEFLLRDIVQRADGFKEALEMLKSLKHINDVHVLLAGFDGNAPQAAVVELGASPVVRGAEDGVLLGVDPDSMRATPAARKRYAALKTFLDASGEISLDDAKRFMTGDGSAPSDELDTVWNSHTRHCAVLFPGKREMQVSFPLDAGVAGSFTVVTVPGGQGDE